MSLNEDLALVALRIPLDKLEFSEKIGEGGFSTVYKGKLLIDNKRTTVAIKELDDGIGNEQFFNEIILLSRCKDDNVVSLKGFCDQNSRRILVFEHLSYGSLDKYLADTRKHKEFLTWVRRLKISIGAAKGLLYLHNIGYQQRVIHRDIKSGNILIDENWEPKIADFGLSKTGPANQLSSVIVAPAAGTPGYLPADYVNSGLLTKEVDVYSFGVVMFELLCGRVAVLYEYKDERRSLTQLAKASSEPHKLRTIIDEIICNDIAPDSLKIYSETAYRCLESDSRRRPTMDVVVKNLETALKFQVRHEKEKREETENENGMASLSLQDPEEDDMYWKEKLPSCYREIIRRADSPVHYSTNKDLYSRLSQGILVDDGTKLFWLSKADGKVCQMIPASEIFISAKWNPKYRSLISIPESRFSKAAEFLNGETINMHCRIRSEMLSLEITYAAYLVFRFGNNSTFIGDYEWYHNAIDRRYLRPVTAVKRDDGWLEIEMLQFVSNGKNVVFEFELNKLGSYVGSVIIEGIEFRPLNYEHGVPSSPFITATDEDGDEVRVAILSLSEAELEKKLPNDYQEIIQRADKDLQHSNTIGGAYMHLRLGIRIDNGKKLFSLNKYGKKCCALLPKDLLIQERGNTPQGLRLVSLGETSSAGAAVIDPASEAFKIRGKMKTRMLSLDTNYAVYLVFRHDDKRVHNQEPVEASIKFDGQRKQRRSVYLEARSDMLTLKNCQVDGLSQPEKLWMEVCIWPCFLVTKDLDEVEVGIRSNFPTRYTIFGIQFRPTN